MRGRRARFPTLRIPATFQDVNLRLSQKLGFHRGVRGCYENGRVCQEHESVPSTVQTFNLQHDFDHGFNARRRAQGTRVASEL